MKHVITSLHLSWHVKGDRHLTDIISNGKPSKLADGDDDISVFESESKRTRMGAETRTGAPVSKHEKKDRMFQVKFSPLIVQMLPRLLVSGTPVSLRNLRHRHNIMYVKSNAVGSSGCRSGMILNQGRINCCFVGQITSSLLFSIV